MATPSISDILSAYIKLLSPSNAKTAGELSQIYAKLESLGDSLNGLEAKIIELDHLSASALAKNKEIIDLNKSARDAAYELFTLPFNISGVFKYVSLVHADAAITSKHIAWDKVKGGVWETLFKNLLWDPIALLTLPPHLQGTNSKDTFAGPLTGGRIDLLGGDDVFIPNATDKAYNVKGGSGRDVILGGVSGKDNLQGGDGNDTIIAAYGAAGIYGGNDHDWLQLGSSAVVTGSVIGNAGSDTIVGGGKGDDLFGTDMPVNRDSIKNAPKTDSDFIIGRGGADSIYGSIGNDFLVGDNFSDSASADEKKLFSKYITGVGEKVGAAGKGGNDTIVGYAGNDVMAGGIGNDKLYGDYLPGASNDLGAGYGNDTLFGDAGDDYLDGSEGLDSLMGGIGNDTIYGGAGNDTLYGEQNKDTIYGGAGNDSIYGDHTDAKMTSYGNNARDHDDRLYGEGGDDQIWGGKGNDLLYGGKGNDTLRGGTENDRLYGDDGDDSVYGGAGNDTIYGGKGKDAYFGEAGTDMLNYASHDKGLYFDMNASKVYDLKGASGKGAVKDTFTGIEIIEGTKYNDVLVSTSKSATLRGGAGDDLYRISGSGDKTITINDSDGKGRVAADWIWGGTIYDAAPKDWMEDLGPGIISGSPNAGPFYVMTIEKTGGKAIFSLLHGYGERAAGRVLVFENFSEDTVVTDAFSIDSTGKILLFDF